MYNYIKNTNAQNIQPFLQVYVRQLKFPLTVEYIYPLRFCPSSHHVTSINKLKFEADSNGLTSFNRCLSCPGCFLANIRITSGVLNASLMAACVA